MAIACCVASALFGQIQPSAFHIAIIDGEGAINNVKGRLAREPVVQVEDRSHRPVAGAYVAFDSPASGPGGVFADGSTHFVAVTDQYGRAVAQGFQNNGTAGNFTIQVHVTYQGQPIGNTEIHQVNVTPKVANMSKNLQNSSGTEAANIAVAAGVLGVAAGAEFVVDGSTIPGNSNLMSGAQVQTGSNTIELFLHNQCRFLMGPNSSVIVQPNELVLQKGSLRGRHFGNCKVTHAAVALVGLDPSTDAVAVAGKGLEVAALDGTVQVLNGSAIAGTVAAGHLAAFGAGLGGSALLYGGLGAAAAAAAAGVAVAGAGGGASTSP
jgi:hypothetical protein